MSVLFDFGGILESHPSKQISEKLYQSGFVSYPRTETDQYDKAFDFMPLIAKQHVDGAWGSFARELSDGNFEKPRNGSKNDQAHPPIHPTAHANHLTGNDKRVYDLITRRFLASCSSDAIGKQTSVDCIIAGEYFSTSGEPDSFVASRILKCD